MADQNEELMDVNAQQVSGRTLVYATLAAIAVEGPLLGLMGFSLLTSLIILVVTSPLLLIFSPLLLGAAGVFAFAMAGFGVAGAMGVLGLSSFVLVYRSVKGVRKTGIDYGDTDVPATVDKMIDLDETVKEQQPAAEASGSADKIESAETVKEQQQDTSVPVTVNKMVELFETLKEEHPHDTAGPITDEAEVHQQDKNMASPRYLQQNVQREIPQVI